MLDNGLSSTDYDSAFMNEAHCFESTAKKIKYLIVFYGFLMYSARTDFAQGQRGLWPDAVDFVSAFIVTSRFS